MSKEHCVVVTTINEAEGTSLPLLASRENLELIIAGDTKTPSNYGDLTLTLLGIVEQEQRYPELAKLLPTRHYSRKNLGYLEAIKRGGEWLFETDDDNYPADDWFVVPESPTEVLSSPRFPNVYRHFSNASIWPRGLPLDRVREDDEFHFEETSARVLVWQGLVDGDPDVDAVWRLALQTEDPITFDSNKTLALKKGVISAFNSQNTAWHREAFHLLYLPHTVSFRYTDILRSFVAQYGVWALEGNVGFMSPNASQVRNAHDLLKDFADEVSMYTTFYQVIEVLDKTSLNGTTSDLQVMYNALAEAQIVQPNECDTVRSWLTEYEKIIRN